MPLWQSLLSHFTPRASAPLPAAKSLPPGGDWQPLEGMISRSLLHRDSDLFRPKSDADYEQDYGRHALVYACVRKIALSAAEPPIQVRLRDGNAVKTLDSHPALDLLDRPNAFYTANDLTHYIVARLLLTGKSYLWKWRSRAGTVAELWPIPTSWVRPRTGDGNRLITAYLVAQGAGREIEVPVADMVALRLMDPATMTEGVGPLQAAQHDHQMDAERQSYLVEFLRNVPLPGMKLRVKGNLTPRQRDDLRAALADKAGRGRRGSPLILEGDADADIIGAVGDLDWPGLTGLSESRICAAFGVPPILVGARIGLDRSTYSNFQEARASFYAETLRPLWRLLETGLTAGLLRAEGYPAESLHYHLDDIQELQEDRDKRAARARAGYQAGLLTRNEARAAAGYPAVAGGD